jgi:hypothetical protein
VGKGIRAPGTLNPKTSTVSLIEVETIKPLLEILPRTWSAGIGKVTATFSGKPNPLSLHRSTNYYFLPPYSVSTKPIVEALLARHPIERTGTRNSVLMQLIGELIHKFGREASERIVQEHFRRHQQNIRSPLEEHIREFAKAWELMRNKIIDSLLPVERVAFDTLDSEHQRKGFLIVRAFSKAAKHKGNSDFEIAQSSLADRLSITPPGRLCDPEALRRRSNPANSSCSTA